MTQPLPAQLTSVGPQGPPGIVATSQASPSLLAAVNDAGYPDGAVGYVSSLKAYFGIQRSSSATSDNVTVIATASGNGRWVRLPAVSAPTRALLSSGSGLYTAASTDTVIAVDLSTGPLVGPINIGANAVPMQRITVQDLKWLINGATLTIGVTGGTIPIQDPQTGAFVTGTVYIKQPGPQAWLYDGTQIGVV